MNGVEFSEPRFIASDPLIDSLSLELRQLIADLGKDGGLISPSVYDTAQVLRFYPPEEGVAPALEWLLRGRSLHRASALETQESPAIVVSAQTEDFNLPIAYRGQDFTWRQEPFWDIAGIYEWIKWSVFRDMPYESETVIVWVRNDLFIDTSQSLPQSTQQ